MIQLSKTIGNAAQAVGELEKLLSCMPPFHSIRLFTSRNIMLCFFFRPWSEITCLVGGKLTEEDKNTLETFRVGERGTTVTYQERRNDYEMAVIRFPIDSEAALAIVKELVVAFSTEGESIVIQQVDGVVTSCQ